ncbi:PEP-CTERM sorting domain-containing protein [Glaciecola sp. MF2-115]|uniref:PEP-CTERM sorting domain-containing protein n=1 Tax=Glaciecola sp. MF2-115 TaxID=3384827 RepID=UPI00399FEF0A
MKKLLATTALLLASSYASAGIVNAAGGVFWDALPQAENFEASVDYTQWWTINNTTLVSDTNVAVDNSAILPTTANLTANLANDPELVGAGKFNMNASGLGAPQCASCELTFTFGGIFLDAFTPTPTGVFAPDGNGGFVEVFIDIPTLNTTAAWLNIYLDTTNPGEFDEALIVNSATAGAEAADAVDGTLWLSSMLGDFEYTADTDFQVIAEPLAVGSSQFFGDAIGGIAQANFLENFFFGSYETSAFGLTSAFVPTGASDISNISAYSRRGSGNVTAATIPEPSFIALFGLSLIGLGFAARRRKS